MKEMVTSGLGKNYEEDFNNLKKKNAELVKWFNKVFELVENKEGFETEKQDIPQETRCDRDDAEYLITWPDYGKDLITRPRRTIKFVDFKGIDEDEVDDDYEIVYDRYTNKVKLYVNDHEVEMDEERRLDITYDILKRIYDENNDIANNKLQVTKEIAKIFMDLSWNKEKALKFINDGYVDLVGNNLDDYEWLDDEVAELLVEYGYWRAVLTNKNLFKWLKLDKKKADKMVENWEWTIVIMYIEDFEWVKLDKKTALRVIEDWDWDFVGSYANKFEWLDKEIMKKLIETGLWYYVAENPDDYGWWDEEIEKMLTEKWYWWYVEKHKKKS